MRSVPVFALLLLVTSVAAQDFTFVNPAPAGPDGDFSLDSTYVLGSTMNVQWTSNTNQPMDLTLSQQQPNDEWEYIFQDKSSITSYSWNVSTKKNLSETPVFFFELWVSGADTPATISHYFNITTGDRDAEKSSPGSSSGLPPPTATSAPTHPLSFNSPASTSSSDPTTTARTSSSTGAGAADATSTSPPVAVSSSSSGLGTGAIIGLALGIPAAVFIGVATGWFFFSRRKPRTPPKDPILSRGDYAPPSYNYYEPQSAAPSAPGTPQQQYYQPEIAELGTGVIELPGSIDQK
ncbi:hypothetical protein B7463_g4739, partial [Scytalidium lignicola]